MIEEFINVLQQIAINADYLTSHIIDYGITLDNEFYDCFINMKLALADFRDLVKEAQDADNN